MSNSNYVHNEELHFLEKVKLRPGRGHERTEGEQMHSSTLSLTSALEWGEYLRPHLSSFTAENDPVSIA
jgi:hypothetical protein